MFLAHKIQNKSHRALALYFVHFAMFFRVRFTFRPHLYRRARHTKPTHTHANAVCSHSMASSIYYFVNSFVCKTFMAAPPIVHYIQSVSVNIESNYAVGKMKMENNWQTNATSGRVWRRRCRRGQQLLYAPRSLSRCVVCVQCAMYNE